MRAIESFILYILLYLYELWLLSGGCVSIWERYRACTLQVKIPTLEGDERVGWLVM